MLTKLVDVQVLTNFFMKTFSNNFFDGFVIHALCFEYKTTNYFLAKKLNKL